MSIADKIKALMADKKLTTYRLSKETGVSYTGLTKILSGQTKHPQIDSLKLIADYFGTSMDYFTEQEVHEEQEPYYVLNEKDKKDIAEDLDRIMNDLDSESSLAFMGEPIDERDRELLRISLENTMKMAREMAKKKYTPKKYRK